ncbi:MAG: PIN domain-containing protein [Candidatus Bathyarchaeia archaeon]
MKIVVDSYAWVELFIGGGKGGIVKEKLGEAEEVYTPDVVLAELARKYLREGVETQILRMRVSRISEASRIIPVDEEVAVRAAEIDHELRSKARMDKLGEPSLIDAIILAVAEVHEALLITGDEHFKDRPETIWIGSP